MNTNSEAKSLISFCNFANIRTTSNTISSNQGNFVFYRSCCHDAIQKSGTTDGVVLYITISSNTVINFHEESSITNCGLINTGNSIIYQKFGQIRLKQNNISDNKCKSQASFEGYSYQIANISQCSFVNNEAKIDECFDVEQKGPFNFYQCNMIKNNCSDRCFLLIASEANFDFCSFLDNKSPLIFYLKSGSKTPIMSHSSFNGNNQNLITKDMINDYYNDLSYLLHDYCQLTFHLQINIFCSCKICSKYHFLNFIFIVNIIND